MISFCNDIFLRSFQPRLRVRLSFFRVGLVCTPSACTLHTQCVHVAHPVRARCTPSACTLHADEVGYRSNSGSHPILTLKTSPLLLLHPCIHTPSFVDLGRCHRKGHDQPGIGSVERDFGEIGRQHQHRVLICNAVLALLHGGSSLIWTTGKCRHIDRFHLHRCQMLENSV
jgi:hypothetical protein